MSDTLHPFFWYGSEGSLVCDHLPEGVTSPPLSPQSKEHYKGRYVIAEGMSKTTAVRIGQALGMTYVGESWERSNIGLEIPTPEAEEEEEEEEEKEKEKETSTSQTLSEFEEFFANYTQWKC